MVVGHIEDVEMKYLSNLLSKIVPKYYLNANEKILHQKELETVEYTRNS